MECVLEVGKCYIDVSGTRGVPTYGTAILMTFGPVTWPDSKYSLSVVIVTGSCALNGCALTKPILANKQAGLSPE